MTPTRRSLLAAPLLAMPALRAHAGGGSVVVVGAGARRASAQAQVGVPPCSAGRRCSGIGSSGARQGPASERVPRVRHVHRTATRATERDRPPLPGGRGSGCGMRSSRTEQTRATRSGRASSGRSPSSTLSRARTGEGPRAPFRADSAGAAR
ncbi:hypothetical protein MOR12E_13230 [Methylobacterium oryzae]